MKIEFDTDSAAFTDGAEPEEISNILIQVAKKVWHGERNGPIRDSNGNRVGAWCFPADKARAS